jgi:ribonucleoside-diphosphate reductase alpha chain
MNMNPVLRFAVTQDPTRDNLLTDFGKQTLTDRYLLPGETFQGLFVRVACAYADNAEHAQRLYDYISRLWFMPSTPVLSNGGTDRGLPISCHLNETDDSMQGIAQLWSDNVWLAAKGGGIGSYWGNVRGVGEKVGLVGETSGIMPFLKVMDSQTLAVAQGNLRRGSAAVYLPIDHPEIEEFIEMRRPTGGDPNRKCLNLFNGVVIPDTFMEAVAADQPWELRSPKTRKVMQTVSARALWIRLLTARLETGAPYILFIDAVNKAVPKHHKQLGLNVKTSNLCVEITLPTGVDHLGNTRSAVCCLSSLNLDTYLEWKDNPQFVEDVLRFLDNVLQDFIDRAPDTMAKSVYSAMRERSVGLGVMGFHSFLQSQNVPFESAVAKSWNLKIFKNIKTKADAANLTLAHEKGACPDAAEVGEMKRFSNMLAIAPTASISIICGGASPGIEPSAANVYSHKTLGGTYTVRNPNLKALLAKYGRDDQETWTDIMVHKGSVQHLDFLSEHEKDVFKTSIELDQRWLIDHAADRTPFICQSQSLNIFLPANVSKKELNEIHTRAWKKGVKSLYYCRSLSIQRAETVSKKIAANTQEINAEECLACQ